jgi:nitroreductase
MDTFEAIRTIRAVRQYAPRPVPDEVVTRILEAGRLTGSSKNTQPWQFILVKDRAIMEDLSKCGDYAQHLLQAHFAIVVVTEKLRSASYDAGRCCQNLMLEAWNEGVGSCIATMHRAEDARKVLAIPEEYELQQVIAFGYPAPGAIRPTPRKGGRKALDEMLHRDRW